MSLKVCCLFAPILEPTRIIGYNGNKTVKEPSNLTLFCNTTGRPPATVTWTRVLDEGSDGDEMFVGNPWITKNIERNFSGRYRCTANNGFGYAVNHSILVNVTCKCIIEM